MKSYKVIIELANKDNPYTGAIESKEIIIESENEVNIPTLALNKISIPSNKIYWQMCWREI